MCIFSSLKVRFFVSSDNVMVKKYVKCFDERNCMYVCLHLFDTILYVDKLYLYVPVLSNDDIYN